MGRVCHPCPRTVLLPMSPTVQIDDFRAGRFTVNGLGPAHIKVIYPLIVTLRDLPLEPFVWNYIRGQVSTAGYLTQPAVRHLTIMSVKDLEGIETRGGQLIDIIRDRLNDPAWRDAPFGNYLFFKRDGSGLPANPHLVERYRELLSRGAEQMFGIRLREVEDRSESLFTPEIGVGLADVREIPPAAP